MAAIAEVFDDNTDLTDFFVGGDREEQRLHAAVLSVTGKSEPNKDSIGQGAKAQEFMSELETYLYQPGHMDTVSKKCALAHSMGSPTKTNRELSLANGFSNSQPKSDVLIAALQSLSAQGQSLSNTPVETPAILRAPVPSGVVSDDVSAVSWGDLMLWNRLAELLQASDVESPWDGIEQRNLKQHKSKQPAFSGQLNTVNMNPAINQLKDPLQSALTPGALLQLQQAQLGGLLGSAKESSTR